MTRVMGLTVRVMTVEAIRCVVAPLKQWMHTLSTSFNDLVLTKLRLSRTCAVGMFEIL